MLPGLKINTGFTPTSISGCQLWFDAADLTSLTLSGSNLTAIRDKSGVTSPTITGGFLYASNSLNGYGVIYNNNGYIRANFPTPFTSSVHTTFLVMVATSLPSDGTRAMSFRAPAGLPIRPLDYAFGSFRYLVRNPNTTGQAVTAFTNSYFIWTCYNSTFNLGLRLNGATDLTTNISTNTTTITGYGFGWNDEGDTQINFPGRIAESLVFNTVLTTAQIERIEAYLAQKWALKNNLPGNHPGITTTIYPSRRQAVMAAVPYFTQFSPTSISGCKIWLDAADSATFTLNGSTVSTWMDKTGNGFNVSQATAGSQPTRGSNEVVFNGSTSLQYSGSVGIFGNSYTSYVIHTPTNNTNYQQGVISIKDSTTGFDFEIGQFYVWTSAGSIYHLFSASVNSKTILGINSTTSLSLNYSINGQPFAVSGAGWYGVSSGSSLLIGNSQFSGIGFIGTINEYLLFTRTLTATEHDQITGYLASKWGSQLNLPSNHPNKTFSTGTPSFTQNVFRQVKRTIGSTNPTAKYSALFNRANNTSLSIPENSVFTLGTNNHTIEFWLYQTTRDTYDVVFSYGNPSLFGASTYFMSIGSYIGIVVGNGAGNWAVNMGSTISPLPALNTWHHYALVRNGTTFTLYINGISRESATSSFNIAAQGNVFRIGNTTTYPTEGYITNFRFVNGTAVYTSNFTPPTSPLTAIPNTQLLLQGLTDRSPNAFTVTNNGGVTLSTTISPFA